MTEHKKLRAVCERIGYWNIEIRTDDGEFITKTYYDPRSVIFTPEFMEKFFDVCKTEAYQDIAREIVLNHLDDPVSYLYNLLELWKEST